MRSAPELSVVVPCGDAAKHLPTLLASLDRNADEATEVVLVDDGSTDATPALLAAFRPSAGRVRVLTAPGREGVSAARDRGVAASEGRYVAFVDADDWLAPGHLQRMTAAIRELDVDFVRTDHVQVEGVRRSVRRVVEGRRWRPLHAHDGIDPRPGTRSAVDAPNVWAGVYRRSLAERGLLSVDPAIRTAEDRLMIWRLHLFAERFAVVTLPGYFYRREVAGSLTTIGDDRQLHFFDAYDAAGADLDAHPHLERFRGKLVQTYLSVIAHHEVERSRLAPAVRRRFRLRAARTIGRLPAALVDEAVAGMAPARAAVLRRLA